MSDLFHQLSAALAGRYSLQRELGRGGMATVFLASDLRHHQRAVAIKVLDPEVAAAIGPERFLREIEIAADLSHIHILPLYDSGVADGLLFYVMPYAEDGSLRQRLEREKQLPIADAVRIAREVAEALDFAHGRGVVHRDIKPENILLKGQHAVVADFGIARAVLASGDARALTGTGVVIGTPACMSPEQAAGSKEVDGRSDQYSLGCVLYEMLAGQPPFTGPTADSIVHQQRNVAPRPVTDLRPTVPEGVARALQRTLAKTPADRFSTTAEFAAAIAAGAEPAPGLLPERGERPTQVTERTQSDPGPTPRSHRVRAVTLASAALVIAYVAVAAWQQWWPFHPEIRPPAKKSWILVAEFDGPAADSSVVTATRDMVMAALDQSEIVATVPREQILVALRNADKPASTRVDAELARELAYRASIRTVLEGRIGRLGKGYSLVLNLVDADSVRVVLSVSDAAKDEAALIPAMDRIGKRLRAGLGERKSAIQATRELGMAMTPSFEAYRTLLKARQLLWANENRAAIPVFRSALALDTTFAAAWSGMAYCFSNLRDPDSAVFAFRRCLVHSERLSKIPQLFAAASMAVLSGDIDGGLAANEQILHLDPQNPSALSNRSYFLMSAGRQSEAVEYAREAEKASPLGPSQQMLLNQFESLLALGRLDEAQAIVPRLRGNRGLQAPMDFAAAAGKWSVAESLATVLQNTPAAQADVRRKAATVLAAVQASCGGVGAADRTLRQAQSEAELSRERTLANRTRWDRLSLAVFSRGPAADPGEPGQWDSTTTGLVVRGAWAAAAGDTVQARRMVTIVRARSAPDLACQGFFGPQIVEGWIAARAGHWEDVLRILGPAAMQGESRGYTIHQSAPLLRWLVADAYQHLGRPDSAAAYLERAIAPTPLGGTDVQQIRMASSFAHQRLALLYARLGRLEEARRHWEASAATCTRPDPELAPRIEEARTALASAEAMAKSARR